MVDELGKVTWLRVAMGFNICHLLGCPIPVNLHITWVILAANTLLDLALKWLSTCPHHANCNYYPLQCGECDSQAHHLRCGIFKNWTDRIEAHMGDLE